MPATLQRPQSLNLLAIRFPIGAICSIGHRIAGVILVLATPFAAYLFGLSLQGPEGYATAQAWLAPLPARAAVVLSVWALAHHVLAGVRHLLMDLDIGAGLQSARYSAWTVIAGGAVIALFAVAALS